MFGVFGDYIIAEACPSEVERISAVELNDQGESAYGVPPEDHGSGTNAKSYFVCNSLVGDWVMLPDVTPKQVTTTFFLVLIV